MQPNGEGAGLPDDFFHNGIVATEVPHRLLNIFVMHAFLENLLKVASS
jgi:hypothetical protein